VARLRDALSAGGGNDAPEVFEAASALIARVEVHPPPAPDAPARIELLGELSAMLAAAGLETRKARRA